MLLKSSAIAGIAICCLLSGSLASEDAVKARQGKLFPVFQVIRFPNTGCASGDGSKNGTCYTAEECTKLNGVSSGNCANGYGICCIFTIGCGATSSQNCTYFESTGVQSGDCRTQICKCSDNVCQLRLDFNTFDITGPSTNSDPIGRLLNGQPTSPGQGHRVTTASKCLTDTFSVTNPGGQSPSVICGLNSGEHMYVEASDSCNDLDFQLGTVGIGTALKANRQWSIKVTQYDCNYQNLAPPGCTQYFYGSNTGSVQTFNFDGGMHLADQDQNICFRQERDTCKVCFAQSEPTDFQLSGHMGQLTYKSCCKYGTDGLDRSRADCATFGGVVTLTGVVAGMKTNRLAPTVRLCGENGLFGVGPMQVIPASVCSTMAPYNVRFLSDSFEFRREAGETNNGFKLYFTKETDCLPQPTEYIK